MSVIFYVAGLVYMLNPQIPTQILCVVSGLLLLAYGIIKLIGYFAGDLYCLAFQYDLGCGLLLLVLGAVVLVMNLKVSVYLVPGLGLLILLDSLLTIQMVHDAKKFGLETWKRILLLALVTGALGVVILVKAFTAAAVTKATIGCALLAEGLMKQCVVHDATKAYK